MITVTRRYAYSARHRLHSPRFDAARNRAVYGKCNNPMGHGHTYGIEITVAGPIDAKTGRIIAPADFDAAVEQALGPLWDHQDLNQTLGEGFITTGENLVRSIFDSLAGCLPPGVVLARVKLHETRKNTFVYFGGTPGGVEPLARRCPAYL